MRFSDLERAIPRITQKMLGQQLKSMEADGIVHRTAYPQVPPKVEYRLTKGGQSLCPALDASVWHVYGTDSKTEHRQLESLIRNQSDSVDRNMSSKRQHGPSQIDDSRAYP
jgi:DNA-binding HxlR family transcriptional regulator